MSKIIRPEEFPFAWFSGIKAEPRKSANIGTRQGRRYLNITTAFDIETSPLPGSEESFLYIWQWQFGIHYTVMGRTWQELREFIDRLLEVIPKDRSLVICVHNLSYEFQFLRTIYRFDAKEVFAVQSRKILKCSMYDRRLEWRCTYLHSNMSLRAYLKKMGIEHQKTELDYSVVRYPWTPLTQEELEYCQNDVLGLVEAVMAEKRRDNDNFQTWPLTSTGYVRREAKRAMRLAAREMVPSMQPDIEQYRLLRECFRGGNTHANRYMVGRILTNVASADRSSSYPDVICNRQFPTTRFRWLDNPNIKNIRYHIKRGHAVAFRVAFWDLTMQDPYEGFPYLPRSKCYNIIGGVYDNGRVLCADYLETSCTDVDWTIICRQYKWKHVKGVRAMWAHYGPLPRSLVLCAIEYYKRKTELKGVRSEDGSAEYMYARFKELLNSLYGMMAQDPVKMSVLFDEDAEDPLDTFKIDWQDPEKVLAAYQRRAFLCYQWGVWTTAWARKELDDGLVMAGRNAVYCDTDSVKYLGSVDWSEYNAARVEASLESGSHATDPHGEEHFMGVFEQEETYSRFITLGAKKYAYEYQDGRLGITVAGVGKKTGAAELAANGGLEAFCNGFIFRDAGGLETIYNDTSGSRWVEVDGHLLELGPNIYLKPSTYTLGQTWDYIRLLQMPDLFDRIRQRNL